MSDYKTKTELLIEELKIKYPDFKIKFKDESKFMKFLNIFVKLFNKKFMSRYTTVLEYTVYFPSKKWMEKDWRKTFYVLSHESIHMASHNSNPVKHVLGYTFPQNLGLLSLLSLLSFINPAFLVFLIFLTALGPWPAPFRVKEETRGHGMNCKIGTWEGFNMLEQGDALERMAKKVCGWDYYNPLHSPKQMEKDLEEYSSTDRSEKGYNLVKKVFDINNENL